MAQAICLRRFLSPLSRLISDFLLFLFHFLLLCKTDNWEPAPLIPGLIIICCQMPISVQHVRVQKPSRRGTWEDR